AKGRFLLIAEIGNRVVADELDVFIEARAAAVAADSFKEPVEIGGMRLRRPAGFEHSKRTSAFDLFFLRGSGSQIRVTLGCQSRRLQVGERFAEEPVELGLGGRKERIEFMD